MKTFILSFFIVISSIHFSNSYQSTDRLSTDSILSIIKKQKSIVDYKLIYDQKAFILFAKVVSQPVPVKVKNQKWPDNVEYSYDILKDSANRMIMILAGPTSESGDWDISYIHYFDKSGNTIAFERRTNFFNSECTDGVAYEVTTKYYNSAFKIIDNSYKLTNEKGKILIASKCAFPYDFKDYKIYKNADECLKAYHINKSNL